MSPALGRIALRLTNIIPIFSVHRLQRMDNESFEAIRELRRATIHVLRRHGLCLEIYPVHSERYPESAAKAFRLCCS